MTETKQQENIHAASFLSSKYISGHLLKKYFRKGGYELTKRRNLNQNMPQIAPGMDDQEELEQSATEEEVEKGEFTSVTTLSFDEVDPS